MNEKQFMRCIKIVKEDEKLLESLKCIDSSIDKYSELYDKLLGGKLETKPKLKNVIDDLIGYYPFNMNFTDALKVSLHEYNLENIETKIDSLITINMPAYRILENKYLGAYYTINFVIHIKVGSFANILFDLLFKKKSINELIGLCRLKGMILNQDTINMFINGNYSAIKLESYSIDMLTWYIDEDLNFQEIYNKEEEFIDAWKKIYLEIKYCLGL